MNTLGIAVLNAMREQGWMVIPQGEVIAAFPPGGEIVVIPMVLVTDTDERRLRLVLLALIVTHGLIWPWPPDYVAEIHGETPITE